MKECLLESLKRLVKSDKCDTDINDEESEKNSNKVTNIYNFLVVLKIIFILIQMFMKMI